MDKEDYIRVDALKGVSFFRNNDLYRLACLVLELKEAKNAGTTMRSYQTVHGLAACYANLINVPIGQVEAVMNEAGLWSGAIIVNINDVIPRVGMTYEQIAAADSQGRGNFDMAKLLEINHIPQSQ